MKGSNHQYSLCISIFLLSMLTQLQLFAQIYPVDANAILIPPHTLSLSDYALERSQDFIVDLTLNDPVEPFWQVRLELTIENNGVEVLKTHPAFEPAAPIHLDQYTTLSLTGFDLAEYLNFENLVSMNGYTHNGRLPEGLNSICIQLFDYNRPEVAVSRKACASAYAVLNTPPLLQFPTCGVPLTYMDAPNIMFTWLPTHLANPIDISSIEYEFTLVRVEEGYNPFDAVEAAMPVLQTNTSTTNLILQEPLLEEGYEYAWRVRAHDPVNDEIAHLFENQGYSEVCTFYWGMETSDLGAIPSGINPQIPVDIVEQCYASCQQALPNNSNLLYDLKPGAILKLGLFELHATEIQTSGDGYFNGKGKVFIPFLNTSVGVEFKNITVNAAYEICSMESTETRIDFIPIKELINTDKQNIASLEIFAKEQNRFVSQMTQDSAYGLPIVMDQSRGGIDYNIIITNIQFEIGAASLDAVLQIEDPQTNRKLPFGAENICFHPNGIGGTGTANLNLFKTVNLEEETDFAMQLTAPGDGYAGTYARFGCQGFVDLQLEGSLKLPNTLSPAIEGRKDSLDARFSVRTEEWGQFMCPIQMDAFQLEGLAGYTFYPLTAILDYSDVQNPEGMKLPNGYPEVGKDWRGLYLPATKLELPEQFGGTKAKVRLDMSNMFIDQTGLSGHVKNYNLLSIEDGKFGDWAFSIDQLTLDIRCNSVVEHILKGQLRLPILNQKDELTYIALLEPEEEGLAVQLNLLPVGPVSGELWNARLDLNGTSFIQSLQQEGLWKSYANLNGEISLSSRSTMSINLKNLPFEGLTINDPTQINPIGLKAYGLTGTQMITGKQEALSDFPFAIQQITIDQNTTDQAQLNVDLLLNLSDAAFPISAASTFSLLGQQEKEIWNFQKEFLKELQFDTDLGVVALKGALQANTSSKKEGLFFEGQLEASFNSIGAIPALAKFGQKSDFRYFFIDTKLVDPRSEAQLFGLDLYGLSGGISYHMKRGKATKTKALDLDKATNKAETAELLKQISYKPDKNTSLLAAADLVLGASPGAASFNADLSYNMTLGKAKNGTIPIRKIGLRGTTYYFSQELVKRQKTRLRAPLDSDIDLASGSFLANTSLQLEPLSPSIPVGLYFHSDKDWWIKMGHAEENHLSMGPDEGNQSSTQENLGLLGHFYYQGQSDFALSKHPFGAFYTNANIDFRFSNYISRLEQTNCLSKDLLQNLNGWYLSDVAEAHGKGRVGMSMNNRFYSGAFDILQFETPFQLEVGLPQPEFLKGDLNLHYSTLNGQINNTFSTTIEKGTACYSTENLPTAHNIIIGRSPTNNAEEVAVNYSPRIYFGFNIHDPVIIEKPKGIKVYYKPEIRLFLEKEKEGRSSNFGKLVPQDTIKQEVKGFIPYISPDGKSAQLVLQELLDAKTQYKVTAIVRWKHTENKVQPLSMWNYFQEDEGVAQEVHVFQFTTGANNYNRALSKEERAILLSQPEDLIHVKDTTIIKPGFIPKPEFIAVAAKAYNNSIALRWAPSSRALWLEAIQKGYQVFRQEVASDGRYLGNPVELTKERLVKPWSVAQWASWFPTNDPAMIVAAEAVNSWSKFTYKESFLNQNKLNQNTFGLVLLSADQSEIAADGLGLRYEDRSIEKGKTYRYYIKIANSNTKLEARVAEVAFTGQEDIFQMRGLSAKSMDRSVRLEWPAETNPFSGYYIERKGPEDLTFQRLNDLPFVTSPVFDADRQQYMFYYYDSTQVNYDKYQYRIYGLTPFGELSEPGGVAAHGIDKTAPKNPILKNGTYLSEQTIQISYEVPEFPRDFAALLLLSSNTMEGPYTTYSEESLNPMEEIYSFKVKPTEVVPTYFKLMAVDTAGNTSYSFPIYIPILDEEAPAIPQDFKGQIDSTGQVRLSWSACADSDLKGYRIFYANKASHEFAQLNVRPIRDTVFLATIPLNTLTEQIYYKIQAIDHQFNASPFTEILVLQKPDILVPVAPNFKTVKVEREGIQLDFTPSSSPDVVQQLLLRTTVGKGTIKQFELDQTATTFEDNTGEQGQLYQYQLLAVDDAGNYSDTSFSVFARPLDYKEMSTVQDFKIQHNSSTNKIELTWNYTGEEARHFLIYRNEGNNQVRKYKIISGTAQRFEEELTKGNYYYAIKVLGKEKRKSVLSPIQKVIIK